MQDLSYENEFRMKFIFMQMKVIFTRMVLHLDFETEAQGNMAYCVDEVETTNLNNLLFCLC